MAWNVPNDWGCYYAKCSHCGTKYHMSEGGCDCSERRSDSARRPWLEDSGYELSDLGDWQRMLSRRTHTARKDHDSIRRGQRYRVTTWKYVCDDTGRSSFGVVKVLLQEAGQ